MCLFLEMLGGGGGVYRNIVILVGEILPCLSEYFPRAGNLELAFLRSLV